MRNLGQTDKRTVKNKIKKRQMMAMKLRKENNGRGQTDKNIVECFVLEQFRVNNIYSGKGRRKGRSGGVS